MKTLKSFAVAKSRKNLFKSTAIGSAAILAVAGGVLAAESPTPKDLGLFYQQNCVRCHGATGNGRDATGKHLRGAVFTDPQWQRNTNDTVMAKVILKGIFFGLVMPSFNDKLTQDEALGMVKDVLHKKFGAQLSK